MTDSDLACLWEWLPFNSDSGSDKQWFGFFTESDFLCDGNFYRDAQWWCLSRRVIASVMVILTVTDSGLACHWERLPFTSDSDSGWQWLWISLRVICSVMVILTVIDSDCVCHYEWLPLWWSVTENNYFCDRDCDSNWLWLWMSLRVIALWCWFCQWQAVTVILTESDLICDGNSVIDGQWLCLSLRVITF